MKEVLINRVYKHFKCKQKYKFELQEIESKRK